MNKLVATSAVAVLSLGLSACGAGQEDASKTSLSESFQKQDLGGMKVDEEQSDCMAGGIVDGVGVEQLQEYGILDEDGKVNEDIEKAELSEGDADTVSAALVDCIGTETIVKKQILQDAMTADQQDCVKEAMTEDKLKELISVGFQGADRTDEAVQELQADMTACMKK